MTTSINKQSFFMKKNSKIMAIIMIIVGIVMVFLSASLAGGAGGAGLLTLVVAGVVILVRSNKPLITFFDDYFETPNLKRFYIDIVEMSTKDKSITLVFEDGKKHSFLLSAFEEDQAREIYERFNIIVDKQSESNRK